MDNEVPTKANDVPSPNAVLTDLVRFDITIGTNDLDAVLKVKQVLAEALKPFTHQRMIVTITSGTHLPGILRNPQ